jgi:putative phage-type endonuclease
MSAFEIVCNTADREAWLAHRGTGVGASEIPILLGESEWGSNLEMYYQKRGELPEQIREQNEAMLWGLLLEAAIVKELSGRAGVLLLDSPARLLRSIEHQWAIATPDALTVEGEPVEVKNLSHGFSADEWAEQIPEKYLLQCQHQMLVTGAQRCLFGALLWGSKLVWEWVPRDEVRIRRIVKVGAEFWDCVESGEPPRSDGHPNARKALAQQATDDEPVELYESEVGDLLSEYESAKVAQEQADAAAKKAKRQADAAKDELAKALGAHRSGVTSSGWTLRWKATERRGYTVEPTTIQQFEIKPPKEMR